MKHSLTFDRWLDQAKLTDETAGEMLGVSSVTIWRLRNGKQWPSQRLAGRIFIASGGRVTFGGLTSDEREAAA